MVLAKIRRIAKNRAVHTMPPVHHFAAAGCLLLSWIGFSTSSFAEVVSRAVGHNAVTCSGGSDTVVSVPFHRPATFSSAVSGSPVVSASTATITHNSDRTLANDELTAEPHYLQFTDGGTRSGRVYPVSSNDGSSITIELNGDTLSGVTDGDGFRVIPYWTLSTLFPPNSQSTIHESAGKLAPTRSTRVFFFDQNSQGEGLAPDRVYFLTSQGWFRSDQGFPAADDTIVPPGAALMIRHKVGDSDTTFIPHQLVFDLVHSTPLRTRTGGAQDHTSAHVRPVPVKLSDLDLDATFSDSSSTSASSRTDELFVYDNVASGFNKPPAAKYFKVAGQWRLDDGATYPVADSVELPPSSGILIRKSATGTGSTVHWVNYPRY